MVTNPFAAEALANFQRTAAVAPSSRRLIHAMLDPLPLSTAQVAIEFGPGTGAITGPLLERLPRTAMLIAFEINRRFVSHLRRRFQDRRLLLLDASAETVGRELRRLGVLHVDAVASSIAMGFMSDVQRHSVLSGLLPFLHANSVLTQYQYIHGLQYRDGRFSWFSGAQLLGQYFDFVTTRIIWLNLPPAFVYACQMDQTS